MGVVDMGCLSDYLEWGQDEFSEEELAEWDDLFSDRAALFLTPTENIPKTWIGDGPLDVTLPIPTPSYHELRFTLYGYRTPRVWVDLIQRQTGKIRWRPNDPVRLTIVRYDAVTLPYHWTVGLKPLIDALKYSTTGRRDGRLLYYFGAIIDDSHKHIVEYDWRQERISHPSEAKIRVVVEQV